MKFFESFTEETQNGGAGFFERSGRAFKMMIANVFVDIFLDLDSSNTLTPDICEKIGFSRIS